MKVTARLRYLNMSPRKIRAVTDVIGGLSVEKAVDRLGTIRRRAARPVEKLLRSARANAENNFALDPKTLRIDSLRVDGGPSLKRYRPRALGRAALIERRTSHLTVVLEGERAAKAVSAKSEPQPLSQGKMEPTPKKEFEVEKKVGREQKPSFVRRLFRRKSI